MRYTGFFSDGKSAARREVAIELTSAYLHIFDEATSLSLLWPYGDIALIESESRTASVRLTRRSDDSPRLHVADPAFRQALLARAPILNPAPSRARRTAAILLASLICVPLAAGAVWFGLPLLAKPLAGLVPHALEERIGDTVTDIIVGDAETCESEAGLRALERLVDRLWVGLDEPVEFDVLVIRHPMVNALAAPGGHILVFSGLLDQASGPDELAGVLAHEIGHVVHRHSMQALVRHFALSLLVTTFAGNDWGLGSATQLLVQFAYSREAEAEADATAVAILERARLNPDGLAEFFARIEQREKKDGTSPWRYVSTHPPTSERIAALGAQGTRANAAGAGTVKRMAVMNAADWAALKAICRN